MQIKSDLSTGEAPLGLLTGSLLKPMFKPLALVMASLLISACASTNSQTAPVLEQSPRPVAVAPALTPQSVQLVTQMQAIQEELKQLRNSIEQQQFEVENISQRQRDLFQGLDQRIKMVESTRQMAASSVNGSSAVVPAYAGNAAGGALPPLNAPQGSSVSIGAAPSAVVQPVAANTQGMVTDIPTGATVAAQPVLGAEPTAPVPAPAGAVTLDQQAIYDQGFDLLRQSRYSDAIASFDQLVTQHPNSSLADDAMYWIGEANYVNRQYAQAISSFRKVVTQYPGSDRVPEALLKVGYVQYEIGDYAKAKQTFTDVTTRYSKHVVAVSAKSRLQRIERDLSN